MQHNSQNIQTRNLIIAGWIILYLALSTTDLTFISENITLDSNLLLDMSYGNTGLAESGSYHATAILFSYIPQNLLLAVTLLIGSTALVIFLKDLKRPTSMAIGLYLTIPAFLLFLTRPQKETIVVCLTIAVLCICRSRLRNLYKLGLITLLYAVYGIFVRKYFLIIIALFLGLYFIRKMPKPAYLIAGLGLAIVLALMPAEFFMKTQGMRDAVNYYLGTDSRIIRTAFLNPYPAENGWYFILNYIYAAFRLHVPIFFTFSYKEIFHMAAVFLILRLMFIGLTQKHDYAASVCGYLVLAHVLTLIIFEPDLGSYLRHITSIFVYFTPLLTVFDNGNYKKMRLRL